jgi:hypothetical protein
VECHLKKSTITIERHSQFKKAQLQTPLLSRNVLADAEKRFEEEEEK